HVFGLCVGPGIPARIDCRKSNRNDARSEISMPSSTETGSTLESAQSQDEQSHLDLIDGLGMAAYATDALGRITKFNEAAAALWGRRPELGKDEWWGNWRLYHPDGSPMPRDEYPLAVALKEK